MILADLSQLMFASLFVQKIDLEKDTVDVKILRHIILNSLRSNMKKFRGEFGELVIACDGRTNWRRELFRYYKASRKKDRDEGKIDWGPIFEALDTIKQELKDYFPYRIIQVDGAEADDIIGVLVHEHGRLLGGDPILILSGDKDYKQLHIYANVKQFSPVLKKYVKSTRPPEEELVELIIRGDDGDGVPSFYEADDFLVTRDEINAQRKEAGLKPVRARPIYEKKLDEWVKLPPEKFCENEEQLARYRRNETLIDLRKTPQSIKDVILAEYAAQEGKGRSKLFNYFASRGLKNLLESLNEF